MERTPESGVLQSLKDQNHFGIVSDSGYSDLFHSPRKESGAKYLPSRFFSSDEFNETPKENLQRQESDSLSVTPKKERTRESVDKDLRRDQQPSSGGWCETPKVSKRDSSLRRRLLMCKSATEVKTETSRTPCTTKTQASARSKHYATVFDSPGDMPMGALATSTLKPELDAALSGRKRRLLFSQVRTSTLSGGDLSTFERKVSLSDEFLLNESIISTDQMTPRLSKFLPALVKENFQTPLNSSLAANLCDRPTILRTPSSTPTLKHNRSTSEDSGFGSLALDKSQDSSVDHDGSFQELLLSSASRGLRGTPRPGEMKRRTRLERQRRLSTLREGGSQSDEDVRNISVTCKYSNLTDRKHQHFQNHQTLSKVDEVFVTDGTTPLRSPMDAVDNMTPLRKTSAKKYDVTPLRTTTAKLENVTPLGETPAKKDYVTPLRKIAAKLENVTPLGATSAEKDDVTPLRKTAAKLENVTPLSGTPAARDDNTPLRMANMKLDNLSLTPALQLVHAMCQRRARMFTEQSPSLEELLKSETASARTPETFRTSMPLAGLIGRKMGLDTVDVLTELKKRNLRHILAVVLHHLSPEDIYRFGQVCHSWSEIIQQDKHASHRRKLHLKEVKAALEFGGPVHVPDAETRLTLLSRSALRSVQAQSKSQSFGTPQSGSDTLTPVQPNTSLPSSSKRDKFIQVAKTLFNDECLKPCPHCQHPARCHPVKREGVCSRPDCSFRFCTACLCASHGSRDCHSQSAGRHRSKKDLLLPGSAQSKRNVRRL